MWAWLLHNFTITVMQGTWKGKKVAKFSFWIIYNICFKQVSKLRHLGLINVKNYKMNLKSVKKSVNTLSLKIVNLIE